jgi:hypothetical protein
VDENSQSSELLEDVTKGVFVIHRSTRITDRVKKSVRFKSDEDLVSVRYFELDETERGKIKFFSFCFIDLINAICPNSERN